MSIAKEHGVDTRLVSYYLKEVESYLNALSPIKRAQEICALNESIQKKIEENEHKEIKEIIAGFGAPKDRAAKILAPYSYTPKKSKKQMSGFLKFILYFSGLGVIFILTLVLFVWFKFTPIINFDQESNKMSFLGGMINLDGGQDFSDSNLIQVNRSAQVFSGTKSLENFGALNKMSFKLPSGNFKYSQQDVNKISYQCEKKEPDEDGFLAGASNNIYTLDFRKIKNLDCDFQVPKNIELEVFALNGNIELIELENSVFIEMNNGQVFFDPKTDIGYEYSIDILHGLKDEFESSLDAKYFITIKLQSGNVKLK
ncbi:hypothetical protein N9O57_01925 [bacterium]|nr:hypothetical protein [bacterium]